MYQDEIRLIFLYDTIWSQRLPLILQIYDYYYNLNYINFHFVDILIDSVTLKKGDKIQDKIDEA
jgi:hypothetical protein